MPSTKLTRYVLHFLAAQIVVNVLFEAAVLWLDVPLNTGAAIGGALACALYTAFIFVKREGRVPTPREKWKLAALCVLMNWLVSVASLGVLCAAIATEADYAYFRQMGQTIPVWLWAAIVIGASTVLLLLFAFAYGQFSGLFMKQKAKAA